MSDNLVLEMLRAIRCDVGELKAGVGEVKERLGILELQYRSLSRRVNRICGEVERIKNRLEWQDEPVPGRPPPLGPARVASQAAFAGSGGLWFDPISVQYKREVGFRDGQT